MGCSWSSRPGRSRLGFIANAPPMACPRCASTQGMRLDTAQNKTDANEADGGGLALLGPGRVLPGGPGEELRGDAGGAIASQAIAEGRALIGGRAQLVGISTELSNHLRGVMKTFGLIVPKGGGRIFDTNVKTLLAGQEALAAIVSPLALRLVLETWRTVRMQAARLDHPGFRNAAMASLRTKACLSTGRRD